MFYEWIIISANQMNFVRLISTEDDISSTCINSHKIHRCQTFICLIWISFTTFVMWIVFALRFSFSSFTQQILKDSHHFFSMLSSFLQFLLLCYLFECISNSQERENYKLMMSLCGRWWTPYKRSYSKKCKCKLTFVTFWSSYCITYKVIN